MAVAIMKTEAAFDLRNLEDLVQEITLLLLHQHPCMVRLFGVTEDRPGLVMEHVKTGSLFTYRRERDPKFFTPRIMTIIALQIARGSLPNRLQNAYFPSSELSFLPKECDALLMILEILLC